MRRSSRFTLVELLSVIGIVAVLAALLVPALVKGVRLSRRIDCASRLHQIGLAFTLYVLDSDSAYPYAEDPVSLDPYYWFWMGRGWRRAIVPYLDGQLNVLYCPSDPTAPEEWESTSFGYSMAFYHSRAQIDAMTSRADTYTAPRPARPQKISRVKYPARKVMVAEWLSNHRPVEEDGGWWCWLGARNCLFADGHVRFVRATDIEPANDGLPDFNLTVHGIEGYDVK